MSAWLACISSYSITGIPVSPIQAFGWAVLSAAIVFRRAVTAAPPRANSLGTFLKRSSKNPMRPSSAVR